MENWDWVCLEIQMELIRSSASLFRFTHSRHHPLLSHHFQFGLDDDHRWASESLSSPSAAMEWLIIQPACIPSSKFTSLSLCLSACLCTSALMISVSSLTVTAERCSSPFYAFLLVSACGTHCSMGIRGLSWFPVPWFLSLLSSLVPFLGSTFPLDSIGPDSQKPETLLIKCSY